MTDADDSIPVILVTVAELTRLRRIEGCARYLVNSNAWVGDTDGIEAYLTELQELLNV